MKKNVVALLLAMVLTASMLAACGPSGASESATAQENSAQESAQESGEQEPELSQTAEKRPCRIVQPGTLPADYETGIAAVNEKLEADGLNMEVEIIRIPWDAYEEKLNLMLTTGEPFEILHVMQNVKNVSDIAGMGAILPLNEYLEDYPDLMGRFTDLEWQGTIYSGEYYAVPCSWKAMDNLMSYMNYRVDIAEKAGYGEFPDTVEGIIDLMEKSQKIILEENGIKGYHWLHYTPDTAHWLHRSYETYPFYVENSLGIVLARQDGTIDSFYESEEFKQDADTYYEIYQKGLINPDILSLDHNKKYDDAKFGGFLPSQTFSPATSNDMKDAAGIDSEVAWVRSFPEQPDIICTFVENLNGISATAEDPRTGLDFLNWLYASDENHDLFHYGVEGTHYTRDENDRIDQKKDESGAPLYAMDTWMMGYIDYMNFGVRDSDAFIDYSTYTSEDYVVSPIAGFHFDSSNVQTELTNLQTEIIASIYPIKYGMTPYEEGIDDAIKKLKAAGLDRYMEEYRAQFATYLEENPQVMKMAKGNQK